MKQQIIRKIKIIKKSEFSVDEVISEKLNAPKDCELFYQFDESDSEIESIHSMKMVLPVENAEQLFLVPIGGLEN